MHVLYPHPSLGRSWDHQLEIGPPSPLFYLRLEPLELTLACASRVSTSTSKPAPKPKPVNKKPLPESSSSSLVRTAYDRLPALDPLTVLTALPEDHKELLKLELDTDTGLGTTYLRALRNELTRTYFLDLKRFLSTETSTPVFPPPPHIYSWSRRTPLTGIKVVIIGQDPYHGPGQAHGLAFSVPRGVAIPGSLRNVSLSLTDQLEYLS